jgi:maltoporin
MSRTCPIFGATATIASAAQAHRGRLLKVLAAATSALFSAAACAVDAVGYARIGTGDAANPHRTCYNLGISGGHYRLGNECDIYGELGLAHAATLEGVRYRGLVMANYHRPANDGSDARASLNQLFAEGRGLPGAPDVDFWLGQRFYGRADVHILDTHFVRMDGAGLGAHGITWGAAKVGIAYFRLDAGSGAPLGVQTSSRPARRVNIDVTDIALGGSGQLRVTATFTRGHDEPASAESGTRGVALGVQHDQRLHGIGGAHRAWLQYAQGSAALDANFGTMTANPAVAQWRVVESLTWQSGAFGGQVVALYGRHDADPPHGIATRYAELSIGARVSYAVSPQVKLMAEAGHMEKRPDRSGTQRLTKLTLAPTWSAGPGFSDRPELRLYMTTARWNDAANAGAGAAGLAGLGDGATRGTSWGVQLETWF